MTSESHAPSPVSPLSRRELARAALAVGSVGLAGTGLRAETRPAGDPARKLAAELDRLAREDDLSGSILFARHDKVLLARSYGFAERGARVPNRLDTRFDTASIPKLFTSLAVLRLVAAGRLALGQTVASAWPGYPNAAAGQATIAQLLSHTAGMGNPHTWLPSYAGPPLLSNRDYFRRFAEEPLIQPPGTGFRYSNNGYTVLGLLIERLTGEPFFEHLERTIFNPLGMTDTLALRNDHAYPRIAQGYTRSLDLPGQWQSNLDPRTPVGTAFGGMRSTVGDLDRFGAAMAAGTLLPPPLMREWTTGKLAYHRGSYGLGCSEVVIAGQRIIGHSGGHNGVAGELMVWPETGYRLSILTNGEPDAYFAVVSFIKQLLSGADPISRVHDYNRALVTRFLSEGLEAARAMHGARGTDLRASEGAIDSLALREIHRGRPAAGLALLRFNIELFPKSSWPRWSLAEALRRQGDRASAIVAYRDYLAMEPDDAEARHWMAALEEG